MYGRCRSSSYPLSSTGAEKKEPSDNASGIPTSVLEDPQLLIYAMDGLIVVIMLDGDLVLEDLDHAIEMPTPLAFAGVGVRVRRKFEVDLAQQFDPA